MKKEWQTMYDELVKMLRAVAGGGREEKCDGCPCVEDYPCCVDCLDKLHKQAADAIEQLSVVVRAQKAVLDKFPRWIPVTERLPELPRSEYCAKMVIAKVNGFGVMPMAYERTKLNGKVTERWRFYWDRVCTEEVTHWMPLPESPKEETV